MNSSLMTSRPDFPSMVVNSLGAVFHSQAMVLLFLDNCLLLIASFVCFCLVLFIHAVLSGLSSFFQST